MKIKHLKTIVKLAGIYFTGFVGGWIAIFCLLNIADQVVYNLDKLQEQRKHRSVPISGHDAAYAWMEEKVIINL